MSKVTIAGDVNGTGVFTIAAPNGNTNRTLTLPDEAGTLVTTASTGTVTQAMLASNVAGNGPAFSAFRTGNQTVSASAYTKVLFTDEDFDTDSCFTSSTFTPTVAGYYQINAALALNTTSGPALIVLYKNGAGFRMGDGFGNITVYNLVLSTLVYANGTTDYFEIYGYPGNGTTFNGGSPRGILFSASMVRSA